MYQDRHLLVRCTKEECKWKRVFSFIYIFNDLYKDFDVSDCDISPIEDYYYTIGNEDCVTACFCGFPEFMKFNEYIIACGNHS